MASSPRGQDGSARGRARPASPPGAHGTDETWVGVQARPHGQGGGTCPESITTGPCDGYFAPFSRRRK